MEQSFCFVLKNIYNFYEWNEADMEWLVTFGLNILVVPLIVRVLAAGLLHQLPLPLHWGRGAASHKHDDLCGS